MLTNLKNLRKIHGISQQKLGAAIGVSQQSINKYENHNIEPDINTLMLLADYFGTTIDYIVGYTDADPYSEPAANLSLSEKEIEIICKFRRLNKKERQSIELIIENYLNSKHQ